MFTLPNKKIFYYRTIYISCTSILGFCRGTQHYKYTYNKKMDRYLHLFSFKTPIFTSYEMRFYNTKNLQNQHLTRLKHVLDEKQPSSILQNKYPLFVFSFFYNLFQIYMGLLITKTN